MGTPQEDYDKAREKWDDHKRRVRDEHGRDADPMDYPPGPDLAKASDQALARLMDQS